VDKLFHLIRTVYGVWLLDIERKARRIHAEFRIEHQIGIRQDSASALKYYQLSADQGHAEAQYHYGRCVEYGIAIGKDLASAVKYHG
jgi:hypothetical protein